MSLRRKGMLRDLLVGTLGAILKVLFGLAGFALLVAGIFSGSAGLLAGGVVCWCLVAGIRYALGHIARIR
jgi:hypothetical protein